MKVRFKGWDCSLNQGVRYSKGNMIHIRLDDIEDGCPVATATVNVDYDNIEDDEVFIKDYSENEGMTSALIEAGIIHPEEVQTINVGFVNVTSYRLTEEAYKYLTGQE